LKSVLSLYREVTGQEAEVFQKEGKRMSVDCVGYRGGEKAEITFN